MTHSLRIYRFKQIDSTNSVAFRYAEKGAPSGSVFVTDYQTKGRGKWGRTWISPRGKNLLFSILLHPKFKSLHAPLVTQIACRSVAKVISKKFRLHPAFKRPNDLLVREKKICGVLVEAKGWTNGDLESLVIGVGLNVNSKPEELAPSATSLFAETGRRQSRPRLFKSLLRQLRRDLKEW